MSSKLAPCPFCGKTPAFREDDGRWLVVCNDVYCGRGQDTASTQRKVANLWNRQWADIRAREFLRLKRENEKLRKKLLKVQFLLDKPRTYRLKSPRETESCSSRVWRLSKMGHSLTPGVLETTDIKRAMRHHLNSEYATYLQGLLL